MATNLFVGNLPPGMTNADLRAVFGRFGTVLRARVAIDSRSGRRLGFGFVEMGGGAGEAARALDGTAFHGHALKVREATAARP